MQENRKRQKVSFGDDSALTIIPIRTEHRANDIIFLHFVSSGGIITKSCNPTFTHQVFDHEILYLFPCSDIAVSPKINILIHLTNLEHEVYINGVENDEDKQRIQTALIGDSDSSSDKYILPKGTMIYFADMPVKQTIRCERTGPPGRLLNIIEAASSHFECRRATAAKNPESIGWLSRAEKIAQWFIETADSVDYLDDRWEALFLFRPTTPTSSSNGTIEKSDTMSVVPLLSSDVTYEFVGYMTLFSFMNPFQGTKIRVCQALVLPPFQGQGLGHRLLLDSVYRQYTSDCALMLTHDSGVEGELRDDVVEITVEDPASGFSRMRDVVDVCWFLHHNTLLSNTSSSPSHALSWLRVCTAVGQMWSDKPNDSSISLGELVDADAHLLLAIKKCVGIDRAVPVMNKKYLEKMSKVLKVTSSQTKMIYEAILYYLVYVHGVSSLVPRVRELASETGDSDAYSGEASLMQGMFEKVVKKRLLKDHGEWKSRMTADQMRKEMHEQWLECSSRYNVICRNPCFRRTLLKLQLE